LWSFGLFRRNPGQESGLILVNNLPPTSSGEEMPNWVYCHNHIKGSAEDISRFLIQACRSVNRFMNPVSYQDWGEFTDIHLEALMQEAASLKPSNEQEFSFHALYPVPLGVQIMPYDPDAFRKLLKKQPEIAAFCKKHEITMSGYDWECAHWGVKWGNAYTKFEEISENHISLYFETAWNPPHPFWIKVSKDFPNLKFSMSYEEEANHFEGKASYKAGESRLEEWVPDPRD